MKNLYFFICLTLIFISGNLPAYSQDSNTRKFNPDQPLFFTPKNHDPSFLKSGKFSTRSFYQRKSDWQHIIDSTWGPGDSLSRKLLIFNTYATAIHDKFDGFNSQKLNYDSLYNHYFSQITESTSKGAFSSIISHFANDFKDLHTWAGDTTVVYTPLNPGVPILVIGNTQPIQHFGANTTILPDSTTLVLRVVPNHPLDLVPGDIILGYEGISWKHLVKELFNAGLPLISTNGGCKSSNTYHNLIGAGLNWHLFKTIDILKYSTGDTLHLSVLPLVSLKLPFMFNNEQLAIPNIPFPVSSWSPTNTDTVTTYGILENTNVGYVNMRIESPEYSADVQFQQAIMALKNTDALIIDMRSNFGGWALFDKAFNILFNEFNKTIEDSYRCNTNTFELCPSRNWATFQINGLDTDYYDRPIAVLLGPSCISMGDLTAHRLRYHPMVRFFGASSSGNFGDNTKITDYPNWELHYSISDMFHVNDPGNYLNRSEFPIDYPVWFNKDDVAKGVDPIVAKSLEWINNLAYGHDISIENGKYSASNDTVKINAIIENPNSHKVSAKLIFEKSGGSVVDSTEMIPLKVSTGNDWQGIWKTKAIPENMYMTSLKVTDQTDGKSFTNKHMTKITTAKLVIDSLSCEVNPGSKLSIQPFLKNAGKTLQINKLTVRINCTDPWVKSITPKETTELTLKPGQTRRTQSFVVSYNAANFPNYFNLKITVNCDGWPYWEKDTTISVTPTAIKPEQTLPTANYLDQNYPNPFNSSTTISWQLAHSSMATLKIFDLVGREVAIPVDEQRPAGKYETQFNAATLPKGVYFYQLKAGRFCADQKDDFEEIKTNSLTF